MNSSNPSLLLILMFLLTSACSCFAAGERSFGREWVPLSEWAQENNFKLSCAGRDESLLSDNELWTLSFKTDSQEASINGVNVWLCNPITPREGRICISALDLTKSIEPILFGKTNLDTEIRTICLDPGHGGKDTGGIFGQYIEKHYTLPLAQELASQLEAAGFKVIQTRTNDSRVELENRPAIANLQRADLFISLHFNVGPPGASGVEVYCLTPPRANSTNKEQWGHLEGWVNSTGPLPGNRCDDQNEIFAYELQKSLIKNLRMTDRGLRRARFAVLRTAKMPAVLIEGGFLTDSEDQKKIADPKYRSQLAAAIVQGVSDYMHLAENHQSTLKLK
ncbi:MAG TPA: N-acetylmuramoyl-L-alanine amidase [Pseudomonadales bacterium]|nr:N-acetylmuramoyl-L-alanine amidase [Pseudomonadales bacterium]